ncbi:MAG: NAD(P)/FAD-dependent oxidoreductase [Spirochaetia bacterium]|nr:NAD(P)/FAD-dependent oxidoreductase [Spirochaetia bacterium]
MKKKIIIIGGGIAGLSTACYAQMNNFESEIFEMHNIPGGVCTSWKRGDYLFDHTLHWVLGSNKGTSLYPIFKELGVADNIDFFYTERFREITLGDKTFTSYTDVNKFEAELLRLFPNEKKGIKRYLKIIRKYINFNPPMDRDFGDFGFVDFLKMLPFMLSFFKLKSITIEDYFKKLFANPQLREILFRLFPVRGLPALMCVMPISFMHKKEGGFPLGGSLKFAKAIESKYIELGGKMNYKCRVKKIIVENGVAKGIELENGRIITADIVISAADGRSTLYDMLDGKYLTDQIQTSYKNPSLWPPIMSLSIGVNRDFSKMAEITDFKLNVPIVVGGKEIHWAGFFHFCHDLDFAPKGKSVIQTQFETDYFYWKNLYDNDNEAYHTEKEALLDQYIKILNEKFPGFKNDIETTDVATPVTWENYTGNWQGSYEGWVPTTKAFAFGKTLPKELPGLQNFYMTGQWITPGGGVSMCMPQGKILINRIVKKERKRRNANV